MKEFISYFLNGFKRGIKLLGVKSTYTRCKFIPEIIVIYASIMLIVNGLLSKDIMVSLIWFLVLIIEVTLVGTADDKIQD